MVFGAVRRIQDFRHCLKSKCIRARTGELRDPEGAVAHIAIEAQQDFQQYLGLGATQANAQANLDNINFQNQNTAAGNQNAFLGSIVNGITGGALGTAINGAGSSLLSGATGGALNGASSTADWAAFLAM